MTDPISNERLMPCPFCASRVLNQFQDEDFHIIQCAQCGCEIRHIQHHKVSSCWNRRASGSDMNIKDDAVDAAKRIRDTAMKQTLAARIPESGHFGAIAQDADWLVDRLTAALPHMGGVEIKPLEWEDADEGMCTKWRAAALGGHYELVSFDKEPGFAVNFSWGRPLSFWFIQGDPDEWGPTGPKMFPTLEEAKAAAQADCQRRILSSLSVKEPEGVPVAWRIGHQFDGENIVWTYFDGADEVNEAKAQPLYASPPPRAVIISDEMARAACRVAWPNFDGFGMESKTKRISEMRTALSSEAHNGREVE